MRRAKKFFQTPKGLATIILVVLTALAAPGEGVRTVAAGLASATIAAGLLGRALGLSCLSSAR